jgi:hypothetical protein
MRKKCSARQSVHNFGSTNATVLSVKERGRPAHGTITERGRPAHGTMEKWAGRPQHSENKWAGRPPSFAKPTQVGGSPTLL